VIELEDVPELNNPVVIAAFEGWNDAGEAATAAIDHLVDVWDAEAVAALDPEDYYARSPSSSWSSPSRSAPRRSSPSAP
jgi:hypothetical protein